MDSKMSDCFTSETSGDIESTSTEDVTISDSEASHLLLKKSPAASDRLKRKGRRTVGLSSGVGPSVSAGISVTSLRKGTKKSRNIRSRYGRRLLKKGGPGGKGSWGTRGYELSDQDEPVDKQDPNYSEGEEYDPACMELTDVELQKILYHLFLEYFENGDTNDIILSIEELHMKKNKKNLVVISLILLALEKKPSHREMASLLIGDMNGEILTQNDTEAAFNLLLDKLPDLVLDTPDATMAVAKFIARAIADDCLPNKFVYTYSGKKECSDARNCLGHAYNLLESVVQLDNVWGVSGGMRPVKALVNQIQVILTEYLSSNDMNEATRCLQELEVPHFYHAFVYEGIVLVVEDSSPRVMEAISLLLKSLSESTILSSEQLKIGVEHVFEDLPEILMNVPEADLVLQQFLIACDAHGFIPKDLIDSMPDRGRKRYVSEDDGGLVKE